MEQSRQNEPKSHRIVANDFKIMDKLTEAKSTSAFSVFNRKSSAGYTKLTDHSGTRNSRF